jgi:hypothetical protein
MQSDLFYKVALVALLAVAAWLGIRLEMVKHEAEQESEALKKSIIASDQLTKEIDGRYAKLVDFYNTQKDLNKELKESNRELYEIIKKQDERILNLTRAVITLRKEVSEGFGKIDPTDTNLIALDLRYPEEKSPFIKWDGKVNRKTAQYRGEWSFGKLPIEIVVTEESRGLWKHRIIGPDWFIVDSLSVLSLPPSDYAPKERNLQFLAGGGYVRSLNRSVGDNISIGGGVSIVDRHHIILNATTNRDVGINYYYQFETLKRKR